MPGDYHNNVWLSFWLIDLGIVLVLMNVIIPLPALVLLGRLAEFGRVLAFVVGSWKQVKTFRK
jgi:hypothetical protein